MKLATKSTLVILVLALTLSYASALKWPKLEDLFKKKDGDDALDLWPKWPKIDLFKPIDLFDIFAKKEAKKEEKEEHDLESIEEVDNKPKKEEKILDLFGEKKLKDILDKLLEKEEAKFDKKDKDDSNESDYPKKKSSKCPNTHARKQEIYVKCPNTYVYGNDKYADDSYDASYETVYGKQPYHKQGYQSKSIYEDVSGELDEKDIRYFS